MKQPITTTRTTTTTTWLAAAGAAFLLCSNNNNNNNVVKVVDGFGPLSPQYTAKKIGSAVPSSASSIITTTSSSRKRRQQKPPSLLLLHALSTDEDTLSVAAVLNNTASPSPSYISSNDASGGGPSPADMMVETLESSFEQPSMVVGSGTEEQRMLATTTSTETSSSSSSSSMAAFGWRAVIVVLCALWASNFAVAKLVMGVDGVDSSLYALSRFSVAAFALAPFALKRWKNANMDAETLKTSIVCGSWVAFGYLGQTLGLLTTTASKSCVICSMHCVFVATVAEVWRVQKANEEMSLKEGGRSDDDTTEEFDLKQLLPAVVAVLGVAIVELKGAGGAPTVGDALSFAQPIGFGTGYLILESLMAKKPEAALPVSAVKLAVVAVASFVLFEISPLLAQYQHNGGLVGADLGLTIPNFSPIVESPVALGGILYTGLVTTALALWVESIAFAKVPATDASLILTTEPLFAAGCGAIALGETFGSSDYVGAALIIGACALSIFIDDTEHHPHVVSEDGGGALAAAAEFSAFVQEENA
eukprot:CAMPEP_0113454408 /NCGR_PEP_ID=MMETSP0014_2-20120614/7847_1 /TAXON_ID=2857 /ORGANISM="Nitzschia sp." /LENGTH=533 /DNA_ID=CAMNT_0000345811 /DNA_START=165 /DNA_END=1766 /DNA_ORIENTATION=- /assembly_acc=CAM_ASM_000159